MERIQRGVDIAGFYSGGDLLDLGHGAEVVEGAEEGVSDQSAMPIQQLCVEPGLRLPRCHGVSA
ncbi:hypothetical protein D3C86_1804910 [compost metagenome]